jgi:hypothetical protein
MAFIPTDSMALATVFYQDSTNVVAQQRFFCGASSTPTSTDLEEIGEALYTVFVAQVLPQVHANWSMTGIYVRALNEEEGLNFVDTNSYPIQGGNDDALNSGNQVTYTATWNTGLVGRSARGRTYGVGLPPTFQNGVRLQDAGQAALQSCWELVLDAMTTAGHAINVVSFVDGGVPRAEGRALPALSVNVRFPLATQRRRLT